MNRSFMDEEWTGLSKRQIWSSILAEEEEQQCRTEGHKWVPAFYCSVCGIQSWEALEAFKETIGSRKKRKMSRDVNNE